MAEVKTKQQHFDELMKAEHVLVHLDARGGDVIVPAQFKENHALSLKLSYFFQGQITYDDQAITCYLKFSGIYHECVLPWTAIWGITCSNGKQVTWPEEMPKELILQMAKNQLAVVGKKLFAKKDKKTAATETENKSDLESAKQKSTVTHLKRIK